MYINSSICSTGSILNTCKQSALNTVEDIIMIDDLNVLGLGSEEFREVRRWAHLWCSSSSHTHLLLRNLVRRIVATEEVVEDGLKTVETDEVERDRGHPASIEVACSNTSLQHLLELWCDGEWKLHCEGSA